MFVEAGMGNITHTMGMQKRILAQKHVKQAETLSVEASGKHHAFVIVRASGIHQDLPKWAVLDHTRLAAASS